MAQRFIPGRFPARVTRSREVAGFILTETSYAPHQRLPRHCHERANFIIVLRGSFTESFGAKTRRCAPSSVIFRPPGEPHANHFHAGGGGCLTVEVAARWWQWMREHSASPEESAEFRDGSLTALAARLYGEFRRRDGNSSLALQGLTLELMAEVSRLIARRPAPAPAVRVERARELIHEHFSDRLTLGSVAESVGAHPVYLAREFRRRYHCTVGEYVRRLRIQFACRELANSDAAIAEVASASGFFDQSHFSRTFKRLTGATPAEYRKKIRPR